MCKDCEVARTMHEKGFLYEAFIYHQSCKGNPCECTHKD